MIKVLLFSVLAFAAPEQAAHVHGEAKMNMAFDGVRGKIELKLPGDSLFGFEHEARSKKDKAAKESALKKLEERISELIVFNSELQCEIKKDIFEVNQQKNHSNVEADFNVVCQKNVVGSTVSFQFRKLFPRIKKLQVDVIADGVQKSLQVTKDGESLELK